MGRFFGNVGFGISTETKPGVWEDVITEREYFGDVIRQARSLQPGENLNSNLTVGQSISIVADAFATENFVNLRYVVFNGAKWIVTEAEVQRPRIILRLGEVWNGN